MAGEGSQREKEVLVDIKERKPSCEALLCKAPSRQLDNVRERRPSRLCRFISVPAITATARRRSADGRPLMGQGLLLIDS